MKTLSLYTFLKNKAEKLLLAGNFDEYIHTLFVIENLENKMYKLALSN